jgi:Cdc37 N terminal kinase binding
MLIDDSKWDDLHLSDDSDVEVDTELHVSWSSPAAGQNVKQQSPQRSEKIDAAKHERTTNEVHVEHEPRVLSPTEVRQDDDAERTRRRRREVNALEAH